METKECDAPCHKPPVDCQLSDWSDWAECDKACDGGQTYRKRSVVQELQNGGKPCDGLLRETKSCNETPCNSRTDCVISEWGPWEECSKTCDGGEQQRSRSIEVPAKFGGEPCEETLAEIRGCNEQLCGQGIDCKWGQWEAVKVDTILCNYWHTGNLSSSVQRGVAIRCVELCLLGFRIGSDELKEDPNVV